MIHYLIAIGSFFLAALESQFNDLHHIAGLLRLDSYFRFTQDGVAQVDEVSR